MKILNLLAISLLLLTSCTDEAAIIEKTLVVEMVESTVQTSDCSDCLHNNYTYKVKLKSISGSVYYYTNFKHEIGDTLVSIFEFTDNREGVIKKTEMVMDSVKEANTKLHKKNEELTLYNELLMGIIQDGVKKN